MATPGIPTLIDDKVAEAEDAGKVWACPVCGAEVLFNCHHDGWDHQSVMMTPEEAADLRENSGEYDPLIVECVHCNRTSPVAPGWRIGGGGTTCPDCVKELG